MELLKTKRGDRDPRSPEFFESVKSLFFSVQLAVGNLRDPGQGGIPGFPEATAYFAFFRLRTQRITVHTARATIAALTTQVPMIRPILQGLVL